MNTISEIEKSIDDILSFFYVNGRFEENGQREVLEGLIREGMNGGSKYAKSLYASYGFYDWQNSGKKERINTNLLEMLIESAKSGFEECSMILADNGDFLGLSKIEQYVYRKLSDYQLEKLPDYCLSQDEEFKAENIYQKYRSAMEDFYSIDDE